MSAPLHPDLEAIRFLIGTWAGTGRGEYPTIEPFAYTETVTFAPGPGKPFLSYVQRTKSDDGEPLHSESGFVRMTADGPELIIAQPTGLTEVHTGTVRAQTLEFTSETVAASPTAKPVSEVARRLTVEGDVLSYTLETAHRRPAGAGGTHRTTGGSPIGRARTPRVRDVHGGVLSGVAPQPGRRRTGGVIVEHVRGLKTGKEGFNAQTGVYEDLMKAGIIDPVKGTRSTLQNAASIAGLLITAEAIVAEEKEEAFAGMPGGGDMQGMM